MAVRSRSILASLVAAVIACAVAAGEAHGACAVTGESVASADVVFVGQLLAVDRAGGATFQLEEVWRGQQFVGAMDVVTVEAANVGLEVPPDPNAQSRRYLVLASERDGVLRTGDSPTNLCARYPFPWDASYAAFRPEQAQAQQDPLANEGVPWLAVLVVGAALVIAVAAFALGASGRRPRPG